MRSLYLSVRQAVVDCEGMDALLLASLVVGSSALKEQTLFGEDLLRLISDVLGGDDDDAEMTLSELMDMVREDMLGARVCPVRAAPSRKLLGGGAVHKCVVREGKKAKALLVFIQKCEEAGVGYCCPSLLQIKYASGARVHELYSHPSEFLIACKNMIINQERTALVLMEVPNSLQLLHCFYIDWDMNVSDFCFPLDGDAIGGGGLDEKIEYVRKVAMRTPEVICGLFIRAGIVDSSQVIQVVVVEGTRGSKVGIHFIFKILVTREDYKMIWTKILNEIDVFIGKGKFEEVLARRDNDHIVDSKSFQEMGGLCEDGLFSLIGMDLHPFQTVEQGLALPFSRKTTEDPMSRPIAIIHVKAGLEIMWEVPCRRVWRAGFKIKGKHPDVAKDCSPLIVLCALHDASICIPSHRCISILDQSLRTPAKKQRDEIETMGGPGSSAWESLGIAIAEDEASRCSTVSMFSSVKQNEVESVEEENNVSHMNMNKMTLRAKLNYLKQRFATTTTTTKTTPLRIRSSQFQNQEETVTTKAAAAGLPEWFLKRVEKSCPGFESSIYMNPKYGSRPSCCPKVSEKSGKIGIMFQINKSPMAICAMAASQVPFTGYKAHTNNGSLFYTDGEEVFVSCMKVGCFQSMISNREGNWHAAKRIERLILNGETDAIPEYVQDSMGNSRMKILEKLAKKKKRKHGEMQYEVGCHDFFHHHQDNDDSSKKQESKPNFWEIEGFVPIPEERRKRRIIVNKKACGKCTKGKTICVSDYVAIPSIDRWASVSGDRTWVRVSPEFLDAHLSHFS